MIQFFIPGPPRGKGRPRFVKATGRTYTDDKTASYENLVKVMALKAMGFRQLMEGPLSLEIQVTKTIPASWSKKRIAEAYWATGKPDADNTAKSIADAMNKIVYEDDAQIAKLTVVKRFGAVEGVDVTVDILLNEDLFD